MKVFVGMLMGSLLVTLVLALLAAGSTTAGPEAQPCLVEAGGSGTHASIQAAVSDITCDVVDVGAGTFTETVTISRSVTIQGQGTAQTAVDGNAGASVFTIQPGVTVNLTGLTVQNGRVKGVGGGIRNYGRLTLSHANLSNNSALAVPTFATGLGGGIYNNGILTVTHSTVSGNSANYGGAIYNYDGSVQVTASTLSGNSAISGGGGIDTFDGRLLVNNSTLSGNSAGSGGGISNRFSALILTNATLSDNSAGRGGGLFNHTELFIGSLGIANSIIANSPSGGDCFVSSVGIFKSGGSNIDSDDSCNFNATGDQPNTDPLLGPLQDNGGPTWTHALLPGSPAIDAANNAACPATDQRGEPRPQDGDGDGTATCDIGAYEADEYISGLTVVSSSPTRLGQVTTLTATVTAGSNVSYSWEFGDTYTATGQIVTHSYAAVGTYTATVTATNPVGSATATTSVIVEKSTVYLPVILRPPASVAAAPLKDAEFDG